jgi:biotin carboxyl carrier protein
MFKCKFTIEKKPYEVEIKAITGPMASVVVNGEEYQVTIEDDGQLDVSESVRNPSGVESRAIAPVQAAAGSPAPANGDDAIRVPMPGVVVRIKVEAGQKVRAGDTVMILESMKMENNIVAPKDGVIQKICVKEGQDIPEYEVIMEYEGRS